MRSQKVKHPVQPHLGHRSGSQGHQHHPPRTRGQNVGAPGRDDAVTAAADHDMPTQAVTELREFLRDSSTGYVMTSLDGVIEDVSASAARTLGSDGA